MWIGSYNGLHKHEGSRVRIYNHTGNDSNSLSNGEMHALFQDRQGFIWVGTTAGLDKLNTVTGKVEHIKLQETTTHSLNIGYIYNINQDKYDNIWVATGAGFFVINYNTLQYTLLKGNNNNDSVEIIFDVTSKGSCVTGSGIWYNTTAIGMVFYDFNAHQFYHQFNNPARKKIFEMGPGNNSDIYTDSHNNMYFISHDSMLVCHNAQTGQINTYPFHFPLNAWHVCMSLQGDEKGNIWIGFRHGGLLLFNTATHQFTAYRSGDANSIISSDYVVAISTDYLNNIWVTTDNGASLINLYTHAAKQIFLSNNPEMLQTMFETGVISIDQYDNIYVPYYHRGILVYNTRLQKVFDHSKVKISASPFVFPETGDRIITDDRLNDVQMGAITASMLKSAVNKTVAADPEKIVWGCQLSSNSYLIKKPDVLYFTRSNKPAIVLPMTGYLKQLFISKDKSFIWYIGRDLNLVKFNLETTKADTVFLDPLLQQQHFIFALPRDIVEDSLHNVWITSQNGLLEYNTIEKNLTAFTTANGLAHGFTFALNCDRQNRIWVASLGGIDYYDRQANVFRNVYSSAASKYMEAFGSSVTASDGNIYFLFGNRLLQITPGNILQNNVKSKSFLLSQLLVNGNPYSLTNASSVPVFTHDQNRLTFQFGVLDFVEVAKTNYSYYLQGLDKIWIDNGKVSELSFNSLPPGNYTLNIKARSNAVGDNESVLQFSFIIKKAFWQTWWFVTITLIACAVLAFTIIRWRIKNIQNVSAEKLKVQQLNAEQYKNQLELEQIINYFTTSLIDKNTVDEVLWDVAKNLIARLGFKECVLYLWNDTKTKLNQKAGYGSKTSLEDLQNHYFDVLPGQGIVGFVAETKEALLVPDTSIDRRYRSDEITRLSEIAVPIIYNNDLLGVIDSEHDERNFFTAQHLQILNTIATLMATKIKSVEAEQLLQDAKLEVFSMNEKLSRAKLEALRSQMNPHFIFNSLNAIQECIVTGKVDAAYEYLSKFSKLQRLVLHNSEKEFISLTNEIEMLQLYLSLEALRFNQSFNYTIDVEGSMDTDEIFIPSLITQPYVENAIWHGLRNKEGAQRLQINCRETGGSIVLEIDDDGIGRKKASDIKEQKLGTGKFPSRGTILAQQRINVLNGQHKTNIQVQVIDKADVEGNSTGTRVIIILPGDFDQFVNGNDAGKNAG